jgi:YD repeat-containing protein
MDAVSVQTTFIRNGFGEVIREVSPDRGTSTYSYNNAGQLMSATDGRGQVVNYTRDILGRVLSKTPVSRPASEVVTYSYDAGGIGAWQVGRLTKVVDGSGTTTFQYDWRGNLWIKRQAVGTTAVVDLAYQYNVADQVTQITYPSGLIVGYGRDTKQRITVVRVKANSSVTSWTNLYASMQYEPFGPLKQATLGNSNSLTQNWGNDGRLSWRRLYRTASPATNVHLLNYYYDNDDNITSIVDGMNAANSVPYAYDSMGRPFCFTPPPSMEIPRFG